MADVNTFWKDLEKQAGLKHEEAQKALEQVSSEMAQALREKKSYTIEGLGTFQVVERGSTNQVHFQPDPEFLKKIS